MLEELQVQLWANETVSSFQESWVTSVSPLIAIFLKFVINIGLPNLTYVLNVNVS